jgi:predicted nucleotidyltransferase
MTIKPANRLGHLTEREQKAASEFAAKVAQQFDGQVVSVMLFGSRARGEAKPDSDMDVAVVLTDVGLDERRAVRYLAVEVWLKYGIYLSTRVWSQAHWEKLAEMQTLLYRNVCRDGVEIHAVG